MEVKPISQVTKDLGFIDLRKFKSQFNDLIVVVSGQEMVDQQLVEQRIAEFADPLSENFRGLKKRHSRKQTDGNIGLLRSYISRRKQTIRNLKKKVVELEEIYQKSKTDLDQYQYLNADVKLREAKAGLQKMEDELKALIQERLQTLKPSESTSSEEGGEE